jgi:hypothetical protein
MAFGLFKVQKPVRGAKVGSNQTLNGGIVFAGMS